MCKGGAEKDTELLGALDERLVVDGGYLGDRLNQVAKNPENTHEVIANALDFSSAAAVLKHI